MHPGRGWGYNPLPSGNRSVVRIQWDPGDPRQSESLPVGCCASFPGPWKVPNPRFPDSPPTADPLGGRAADSFPPLLPPSSSPNPPPHSLWTCHGLFSNPLAEVLEDAAAFLREHPAEVILLDVQELHEQGTPPLPPLVQPPTRVLSTPRPRGNHILSTHPYII